MRKALKFHFKKEFFVSRLHGAPMRPFNKRKAAKRSRLSGPAHGSRQRVTKRGLIFRPEWLPLCVKTLVLEAAEKRMKCAFLCLDLAWMVMV